MTLPMRVASLLLVALCIFSASAQARSKVDEAFAALEARDRSRIGVAAIDASTQQRVEYRASERFLMCSTFKVLAAAAVLKRVDEKQEKLEGFVRYGEEQLLEYAPVTRAQVQEGGMTVEALCAAAIEQSDNTAANLLIESIGGPKGVTQFARFLDDTFTRLDRKEPELNVASPDKESDTTTPRAMCNDLQRLFTSDVLSAESRARLERWMSEAQTGLQLIRASIPPDWKAGDKTGRSGEGATNDIAILRPPTGGPIFIAIYTVNPNGAAEARNKLIAETATLALQALAK